MGQNGVLTRRLEYLALFSRSSLALELHPHRLHDSLGRVGQAPMRPFHLSCQPLGLVRPSSPTFLDWQAPHPLRLVEGC
jgi:hypothetical protein